MSGTARAPRLLCERFEAKGRFRDCLAAIPAFVVQGSDQAALLGASRALDAAAATSHALH